MDRTARRQTLAIAAPAHLFEWRGRCDSLLFLREVGFPGSVGVWRVAGGVAGIPGLARTERTRGEARDYGGSLMLVKCILTVFVVFQFTLSVDVDLAVFNVTVLGDDGRPVAGLTADQFRVFEDGREEKIKIFQPEDTPATVGLLIDASGSMRNKRPDVIAAGRAFIEASHPK